MGLPGLTRVQADRRYSPPRFGSILLAGDSITAKTAVTAAGAFLTYETGGYFTWANAYLGQRMSPTFAGVSGETATQIVARLDALLAADRYEFVHLLAGTNDAISGVPTATTQAAITSGLDKIAAAGSVAIVGTIPPFQGGTTPQLRQIEQHNRWVRRLPLTRRGVYVAEYHGALAAPSGGWLGAGTTAYSADDRHPSSGGAARMGKVLADLLRPLVRPLDLFPASNVDVNGSGTFPQQLMNNPLMTGTGGTNSYGAGLTGSIANNFTVATVDTGTPGTVVASKVPRTDQKPGEWQQFVCSGATPPRIRLSQNGVLSAYGLVAGDQLQIATEIQCDADLAGVLALRNQIVCFDSAAGFANRLTLTGMNLPSVDGGTNYPYENRLVDAVILSPRGALPANANSVALIALDFIGTGTIRVGRSMVLKG